MEFELTIEELADLSGIVRSRRDLVEKLKG